MMEKIKHLDGTQMYVDGVDLMERGVIVESFKVGPTQVTNDVFQGRNRTGFNVLSSTFGMREIEVNLFYSAKDRREITLKKSAVDALMFGKVELALPDGFLYSSILKSAGEMQILGVQDNEVIALCSYAFEGVRHDPLATVTGNTVYCPSTMPKTDCRLTCMASKAYASLLIDTVTITNVSAGDVLVVDGIEGRILQNGGPCAGNMNFLHFPALVPGENVLSCPETLTVDFYPAYI